MRATLRAVDSRLPLSYSNSLKDALDDTVVIRRALTILQTAFAVLALFLSLVGVIAVVGSSVLDRRRQIGIRVAVGAHRIYRLVLKNGLLTTWIGLAVGILGAATLSGFLEGFLFDVAPSHAGVFLLAGGLLAVAAALACLIPARHAATVDPLEAVRTR